MKKFVKLAAVLAALILVASCFMACKNDSDDDYSISDIQGMWFGEAEDFEEVDGMTMAEGYYVNGDKAYGAVVITLNEKTEYYYFDGEDDFAPVTISVSGTTITLDGESSEFSIDGNKLIIKELGDDGILTKASGTPTKVSDDNALEEQVMKDFGLEEED